MLPSSLKAFDLLADKLLSAKAWRFIYAILIFGTEKAPVTAGAFS